MPRSRQRFTGDEKMTSRPDRVFPSALTSLSFVVVCVTDFSEFIPPTSIARSSWSGIEQDAAVVSQRA